MKYVICVLAAAALVVVDSRPAMAQRERDQSSRADVDRQGQRRQQAGQSDANRGARRGSAEGRVVKSKKVGLRGTNVEHLIVLLERKDGRLAAVDLGPVKNLAQAKIATGDTLYVSGDVIAIGDRDTLMASRLERDGQAYEIDRRPTRKQMQHSQRNAQAQRRSRQARMVSDRRERAQRAEPRRSRERSAQQQNRVTRGRIAGNVVRTKLVDVKGTSDRHLVALLETDRGNRVPVNLGPSQGLKEAGVRSGKEITVFGALVKVGDKTTIVGEQVEVDGRRIRVEQRPIQRLQGEVTAVKTVRLRGRDRDQQSLLARIETSEGRTMFVSLAAIPNARELDLQEGDTIQVEGRVVPMHQRRVVLAHRVRSNGQVAQRRQGRDRTGQQESNRRQQDGNRQGTDA